MNNKRDHFRLEYPKDERPVFVVDRKSYEICDVSEHGLKFQLRDGFKPMTKTRIKGVIHFGEGRTCAVEGVVLRMVDAQKQCVVKLTTGVPLPMMMEEQRRLIRKYKR